MGSVVTLFHRHGDELVVERVQDCEAVMEQAKRMRNEGRHGTKDLRHVARYPRVIVEAYCNRHGITLEEWMRDAVHVERMLADRDLSALRIGA